MKLFIHCGLHKTATSSFQNFCRKNQDQLFSLGVFYPNYSTKKQHSYLLHEIQSESIEVAEQFFSKSFRQASPKCHTVLLSGEDFENCIVDVALAQEIENAAKKSGFESVTWIIVTRNQVDLVHSLYAEMSKHGVVLDYETMKHVARERGCLYVTTRRYNYIFVLEYSRFEFRFKNSTKGTKIQIPYDKFVEGFVGKEIFSLIFFELEGEQFEKIANFNKGIHNARLKDAKVESNYLSTAIASRRKILFPLLIALYQWIISRKIILLVRKAIKRIS